VADNAKRTGPALEAHYQFLLWLLPTVEKFPRNHKFTLGDRVERYLACRRLTLHHLISRRDSFPSLLTCASPSGAATSSGLEPIIRKPHNGGLRLTQAMRPLISMVSMPPRLA